MNTPTHRNHFVYNGLLLVVLSWVLIGFLLIPFIVGALVAGPVGALVVGGVIAMTCIVSIFSAGHRSIQRERRQLDTIADSIGVPPEEFRRSVDIENQRLVAERNAGERQDRRSFKTAST